MTHSYCMPGDSHNLPQRAKRTLTTICHHCERFTESKYTAINLPQRAIRMPTTICHQCERFTECEYTTTTYQRAIRMLTTTVKDSLNANTQVTTYHREP